MTILASLGHSGAVGTTGQDALLAAARWLQALLLGSVASLIAIVAVAVVGLLMLNGRIDIRRGVTTILGCFLLFGAPAIAAGLSGMATDSVAQPARYVEPSATIAPPRDLPTPGRSPAPYDPYAGASVRPAN